MRSFFNRFKGDQQHPDSRSSSRGSQHVDPSGSQPPPVPAKARSISRPSSISRSLTPLQSPGLLPSHSSSSETSSRPLSHVSVEGDSGEALSHGNGLGLEHGGMQAAGPSRKVTFRSPVPTPTSSAPLDTTMPVAGPSKPLPSHLTPRESATLPRPGLTARKSSLPPLLPLATHQDTAGVSSIASPVKSYTMSPTPSDSSAVSNRSYLPPPNSWSEMAEEELIANLGPKERTRQEVLWEIVSSEERYVQELLKLNDTFCKSLLPPSAASPSLSLYDPIQTLSRTLSPSSSNMSPTSSSLHSRDDSFDFLPIAAKYSSTPFPPRSESTPTTSRPDARYTPPPVASARMDAYQKLTNGRPGLLPMAEESGMRKKSSFATIGSRMRGHQSMPPPARSSSSHAATIGQSFSASYARMSHQPSKNSRDPRSASTSTTSSLAGGSVELSEDLEKVLSVLAGGILEGHIKLAAALRKRYENQYPLVRSLADVFNAHSYILREYATYVLHLEKALAQVDNALSLALQPTSKRHSRQLDTSSEGRLGKMLLSLEELAVERGESGLVISLSKPFQRLLKYPLLFQNLLFNTDPSLREYEATLAMVDDVELIVRTIEDEKADSEEREKTRDVWARIDGLEKEEMLVAPKPNRMLISETQLVSDKAPVSDASQRQKKSFRRLSDILKRNEASDLWLVRFSDVTILCERTGTTSLPTSSTLKRSPDSAPDLSSRAKRSSRRIASVRPRNLYRFVKVHEWHMKARRGSAEATLLMGDITPAHLDEATTSATEADLATPRKSQAGASQTSTPHSPPSPDATPTKIPLKTNDGPSLNRTIRPKPRTGASDTDTLVSDRLSVMSFAFKGGDQVRPVRGVRPKSHQPPSSSGIPRPNGKAGPRESSGSVMAPTASSLQRRSSGGHMAGQAAAAKFAHRLRSTGPGAIDGDITIRPTSKSRRSLPPAMILDRPSKPSPTEVQVLGRPAVRGCAGRGGGALSPTDRMNTSIPHAKAGTGGTIAKSSSAIEPANGTAQTRIGGKTSAPPTSLSSRRLKPTETGAGTASMSRAGSGARSFGGKI